MKVEQFRRMQPGDMGDAPQWGRQLADVMNRHGEQVSTALQKKLSFGDNFNAQEVILELEHDTETLARVEIRGKATNAFVTATPQYYEYLPDLAWGVENENSVKLKVKWRDNPPTGTTPVHIFFFGD